ncbi:hypothetical protein D3C75_1091960 [compost metagenome]
MLVCCCQIAELQRHTGIFPARPQYCCCRFIPEAFKEGIGEGIRELACRSGNRGHGGAGNEELQRLACQIFAQQQGPGYFRGYNVQEILFRLREEHAFFRHPCQMNNPGYGSCSGQVAYNLLHLFFVRYIAAVEGHV